MPEGENLVLIANDDHAVREALKFTLKIAGLSVNVHRGGAEVLADADLPRARCIILDDSMAQMNPFELLSELRDRDIRLPAIMLTNNATPVLRARAGAAGVRLVLEKPLMDNALVEGILSMLRRDA